MKQPEKGEPMKWQDEYQSKLMSAADAAARIKDGNHVWISPCCGTPINVVSALQDRAMELNDVHLYSGQMLVPFDFLKEGTKYKPHLAYHTVFFGTLERKLVKGGNIDINSAEFSQLDTILEDVCNINAVMADVSAPDEDGYMSLGPMGVCITPKAFELADLKIVQVNKLQPPVNGSHTKVHVSEVDCIVEGDHALPDLPQALATEIDRKIADLLCEEIPDGSTIQLGLGGLANAIGYGLTKKHDLSIRAEMISNSTIDLVEQGAVTGPIKVALAIGSADLYKWAADHVEFAPFWEINDPYEVRKTPGMISINQCLMCDLTGQVCSESVGYRQVSGIGGQIDFVRGASESEGGKSFLCLSSTSEVNGELVSNIVVGLPEGSVVTTPRKDVMYIVTEYGIANLKNRSIADRVNAMISIAHPDFREGLRKKAIEVGLIQE